jgi:hypothetical protein
MFEIDAVITWVDGSDPAISTQRDHYMSNATAPLHENAINPHRWICSDELHYCLRSIANHAPWVRRIWIVTDNQLPEIPALPDGFVDKITIIDHREIFAGYDDALPTFNSLSIETMLWRIPGLAEHFLYFNDDVFLTAAVNPDDFFTGKGPILRGKWVDYSHLPDCDDSRDEASLLNHYNQINAAQMMGFSADHLFASAHVVHPMQKTIMADLFAAHNKVFIENIRHRFRCTKQFLAQSLFTHSCLQQGIAHTLIERDYLHIAVGGLKNLSHQDIEDFMESETARNIKFICVNDLPEVEQKFPKARDWINHAIGS